MISKLKIALVAALLAAVAVPLFSATSDAAPRGAYPVYDRHANNGW
jgi:hypothetical protein